MDIISVIGIAIGVIGSLIGVISLIYAYKTNREKERFEELVRDKLAGIAGNIWYSHKSADLSDKNFFKARDEAYKLDESDKKQNVLKHIHNGARDAVATKRMLLNLLGEVLSLQKGMFGTEKIAHPEMDEEQIQQVDKSETQQDSTQTPSLSAGG
jgi:hypothetical protein